MNSKFKIGEIVVCIDATVRWFKLGGLKLNEMYTITGFNDFDGGLILEEVKSPRSGQHAYSADRFRKVDRDFADVVMRKMVKPAAYELIAPEIDFSKLN